MATRVCVLLLVCVVVLLHKNAVGFSFRKQSPVVIHFLSTLFLFVSFFYFENNCRFSLPLPILLMVDVVVVLLVAVCCCGVLLRFAFVVTVMCCCCDSLLWFAVVVCCCSLLL